MLKQVGAGKTQSQHWESLCSEQWDHPDDLGLHARYAVFSVQRTGSGWLCDYLRQCRLGVPFEYFNHMFAYQIGKRLGCIAPEDGLYLDRYIELLEPLRAPHGIFGVKLQPDQLRWMSGQSDAEAIALLRRFDRLILLRRRDRLLQAISLARANLTKQWQLYGDDRALGVTVGDQALFPMIRACLVEISENERYMAELAGQLDPRAVRMLWYEDLMEPYALDGIAEWLWNALGSGASRPTLDLRLALARKRDGAEALAIKTRYLACTGAS